MGKNKTPRYFCILPSYERLAKLKIKKLDYEILKMTNSSSFELAKTRAPTIYGLIKVIAFSGIRNFGCLHCLLNDYTTGKIYSYKYL